MSFLLGCIRLIDQAIILMCGKPCLFGGCEACILRLSHCIGVRASSRLMVSPIMSKKMGGMNLNLQRIGSSAVAKGCFKFVSLSLRRSTCKARGAKSIGACGLLSLRFPCDIFISAVRKCKHDFGQLVLPDTKPGRRRQLILSVMKIDQPCLPRPS